MKKWWIPIFPSWPTEWLQKIQKTFLFLVKMYYRNNAQKKVYKFPGEGKLMQQLYLLLARIIKIMWGTRLINITFYYNINILNVSFCFSGSDLFILRIKSTNQLENILSIIYCIHLLKNLQIDSHFNLCQY